MEYITNSNWLSALVVLITQILFLYFRTLNVIFTAERKMIPTQLTGIAIGACWLLGIAIGVDAVKEMKWQPITAHLIGGVIGTWFAFKSDKK